MDILKHYIHPPMLNISLALHSMENYFILLKLLNIVLKGILISLLANDIFYTGPKRVNTTCRDIQTAVIKTCAYTNRYALKCAFGEAYNELYPGTIYSPPSYNAHFSSTEG